MSAHIMGSVSRQTHGSAPTTKTLKFLNINKEVIIK